MSLDPRTPILVGVGQVNERDGGIEPVDLMVRAARAAADDAGSARLLELVDSVRVVGLLSWRYRDPGALVGERGSGRSRALCVSLESVGDTGLEPVTSRM